jgi:hypothetical protein
MSKKHYIEPNEFDSDDYDDKYEKDDDCREKTVSRRTLSQMLRDWGPLREDLVKWLAYIRPRMRSECINAPRPCPHVSCRYHLYLDVNEETGSIKLNFPDKEVYELEETCALDVAERGGITLEDVGILMNLTRERIRQVEALGLRKVRETIEERNLTEDLTPDDC